MKFVYLIIGEQSGTERDGYNKPGTTPRRKISTDERDRDNGAGAAGKHVRPSEEGLIPVGLRPTSYFSSPLGKKKI